MGADKGSERGKMGQDGTGGPDKRHRHQAVADGGRGPDRGLDEGRGRQGAGAIQGSDKDRRETGGRATKG